MRDSHHEEVLSRKFIAEQELVQMIDTGAMDEAAGRTGLFIRQDDVLRLF